MGEAGLGYPVLSWGVGAWQAELKSGPCITKRKLSGPTLQSLLCGVTLV